MLVTLLWNIHEYQKYYSHTSDTDLLKLTYRLSSSALWRYDVLYSWIFSLLVLLGEVNNLFHITRTPAIFFCFMRVISAKYHLVLWGLYFLINEYDFV